MDQFQNNSQQPGNYQANAQRTATPVYTQPPVYQAARNPEDLLPPQYKPLGAWAYFGYSLLFALPLVGFIMLIVFSLSNDNINRRNFARSFWCWYIIAAAITVIVVIIAVIAGTSGVIFSPRYY